MKAKTSADYQREFRKRLREKGLVKKEVWILPEHTPRLSIVEKQLRIATDNGIQINQAQIDLDEDGLLSTQSAVLWSNSQLFEALAKEDLFVSEQASIELIEGIEPALYLIMHDYGDLEVFLNVTGEQVIVESILWPKADVVDITAFNDAVLRTHKYFPLSTISLEQGSDGVDYYMMFGALSSASLLSNIVYEIEVLASNVIQAANAYAEFIVPASEAS